MTYFLLLSVPSVTFLIVWHYLKDVSKEKTLETLVNAFVWALVIFLARLPLTKLARFDGDLIVTFWGSWIIQFLWPFGLVLVFYSWQVFRQKSHASQERQLLELTYWLGSYFSLEGLWDVLFYTRSYDMTELFFFPLLRVLFLAWIPICFIYYKNTQYIVHKALGLLAIGGLSLFGVACILLSYSQWTAVVWGLLGSAFGLSLFWLDVFYRK